MLLTEAAISWLAQLAMQVADPARTRLGAWSTVECGFQAWGCTQNSWVSRNRNSLYRHHEEGEETEEDIDEGI